MNNPRLSFAKDSVEYLKKLQYAFDLFPHKEISQLIQKFKESRESERTIFLMGNGGSASTASHWVCDILKGCSYGLTSKPFKILSLNDNLPTLLAYANDVGYEDVFVEQLKNFCKNDDLLIAISGSGNSKNVIKAIEYGRTVGAYTVALTGYSGGKLKELAHLSLHINVNDMQVAEDCHSIIMHSTMQSLLYGTT